MFYLRDLPDDDTLDNFSRRYANFDITAMKSALMLLRTGSDLLTGLEKMLASYGLSQGRFLTLIVLHRTPETPQNPSELAHKVGVTKATMTGLLDGLEKSQLIKRYSNPDDRRAICICLTEKGKETLEQILPDYYNRIHFVMEYLSKDELIELYRLLEIVNKGLPSLEHKLDTKKKL